MPRAASPSTSTSHVRRQSKRVCQVKTYLIDALGSVIAIAKADQTLEVGCAYSPYGQTQKVGVENQLAGSENNSQYTGRENDAIGGSGLYYYRARYYDPVLKRFISEDPIGLDGGVNVFGYVDGDPISWTDPEGLTGGPISLGSGWTGRLDAVPASPAVFEIHVFDNKGNEAGMYGKDGWFNKHGHKGRPENCPTDVENQLKGKVVDYLRRAKLMPPKGQIDIKKILKNARRGGDYNNNYPTILSP